MTQQQRDRITASAITITVMTLLVIALTCLYYRVTIPPMEERRWPPVDSSEIVFGGEFVKLGDMPVPVQETDNRPVPDNAADAALEGSDLTDAGEAVAETPPLVSTANESPMKVKEKPKPEKTGPTKEELAEQARIKREKEEAEKQARIKNKMRTGFNNTKKAGKGESGSPNGNSNTGALSGMAGHSLKGRTAEAWGRPNSTLSGTIRIRVTVNRKGQVIGLPSYIWGEGPAAANAAVRQNCIKASQQSKFSVDLEAPATQTGVITWKFE